MRLRNALTGQPLPCGFLAVDGALAEARPDATYSAPVGATASLKVAAPGFLPVAWVGPLSDHATLEAALMPARLRFLAFGDSLTAGLHVSEFDQYPRQLGTLLEQAYPGLQVTVVNLGRGGETFRDALRRVPDVMDAQPDVLLVAFGTNDATRTPIGQFPDSVDQVLKPLSGLGCPLMLADIPYKPRWAGDWNGKTAPFDAAIAQAAERDHASLVSWSRAFRKEAQRGNWDLFYHDSPYDPRQPDWVFQGDYHPNAAGQAVMARAIASELETHVHPGLRVTSSDPTKEFGPVVQRDNLADPL